MKSKESIKSQSIINQRNLSSSPTLKQKVIPKQGLFSDQAKLYKIQNKEDLSKRNSNPLLTLHLVEQSPSPIPILFPVGKFDSFKNIVITKTIGLQCKNTPVVKQKESIKTAVQNLMQQVKNKKTLAFSEKRTSETLISLQQKETETFKKQQFNNQSTGFNNGELMKRSSLNLCSFVNQKEYEKKPLSKEPVKGTPIFFRNVDEGLRRLPSVTLSPSLFEQPQKKSSLTPTQDFDVILQEQLAELAELSSRIMRELEEINDFDDCVENSEIESWAYKVDDKIRQVQENIYEIKQQVEIKSSQESTATKVKSVEKDIIINEKQIEDYLECITQAKKQGGSNDIISALQNGILAKLQQELQEEKKERFKIEQEASNIIHIQELEIQKLVYIFINHLYLNRNSGQKNQKQATDQIFQIYLNNQISIQYFNGQMQEGISQTAFRNCSNKYNPKIKYYKILHLLSQQFINSINL